MQRLASLATIALIVGTGYTFLNDASPPQEAVQQDAPTAGSSVPGFPSGQSAPPAQQRPSFQPLPNQSPPPGQASTSDQPQPAPRPSRPAASPPQPKMLLASYNVQVFGAAKEKKVPVMQTLAAVMQNFDLIAIQEIRIQDDDLLRRFLTQYLNPASGRSYDYILGPRLGRSHSKEQYAYIFDTARIEANPNHSYTIRDPQDMLHREPLVTMFRTRGPPPNEAFTFVLVNIHTDPDEVDTEVDDLAKVYRAVRDAAGGEDDIIILGDLNVDDRNLGELGRIPGIKPLISGVYTNTRQSAQYDNIIIHRPSTTEYAGRSGVFDTTRQFNLTQEQSLQVSDHFPVWAEFNIFESSAPGRVAYRPR